MMHDIITLWAEYEILGFVGVSSLRQNKGQFLNKMTSLPLSLTGMVLHCKAYTKILQGTLREKLTYYKTKYL